MKKNYTLFLAFLLITGIVFSKSVDVNYAMQVAQNFYSQTTGKPATFTLAYQCLNTDATNGVTLGEPLYYVFNASGNKGFVMVSADDLVNPIIGYNTQGQFVIQNAPPVIADWYVKYSKQIAYAKANLIATTQDISNKWNNYYNNVAQSTKQLRSSSAVSPLVETTWDQDLYYNAYCPQDASSPNGYGGNCPTGCGATAMSQIMRYWSYPAQGTGSNSYTSNYGTLSANFGTTTYNWANMPYSVTSANNDVATIMYDCGVAVDMVYGPNESSSYIIPGTGVPASCEEAYTTYFGYNPATIQGLERANYADGDWTTFIQNDLDSGRPIQYAGQGSDGGHTFVLDGADGSGYFHINWGWSGSDNGYYTIDGLNPAPTANGTFDEDESMVIGIEPLNVTVTASGIDLYEAITVNPNPIAFDETFTVTTNVINDGTAGFNGSYCAALFDSTGNFIRFIGDILSTDGSPLPSGDVYNNGLTFSDTTQAVTVPGTYYIGIFYQTTGSNTWTLAGASTYTNPITITISGPTNTSINLYSNIEASPSTLFQGQGATISVNLTNLGTDTFFGQYEVVLLDLYGNVVEELINTYTESAGLPYNYSYTNPLTFTTNSITATEGQYILAVAEEQSGSSDWYYCGGQSYQNPVLIDVINSGFTTAITETTTNSPLKIYPNPASGLINIDAGNALGNYTLKIFNAIGQQMGESNGILNGQILSADVSNFAAGIYLIQLKTGADMITSKFVVK